MGNFYSDFSCIDLGCGGYEILTMTTNAVPEPHTLLLLGSGVLGLGGVIRRKLSLLPRSFLQKRSGIALRPFFLPLSKSGGDARLNA